MLGLLARLGRKDAGAAPVRVAEQASKAAVPRVAAQTDASLAGSHPRAVNLLSRRAVALTASMAAIAIVAALVASAIPGTARRAHVPVATRPPPRVITAVGAPHAASAARPASSASRSASSAPPVPVSPVLATALEARGHSLLQAGRYRAAVPVLKRAVLATGESLSACLEPASSTCLTYAYALYDLGRALRLTGDPAAAIAILARRLQIDNQRSTVDAELQLAREGIA